MSMMPIDASPSAFLLGVMDIKSAGQRRWRRFIVVGQGRPTTMAVDDNFGGLAVLDEYCRSN